MALPPKPFYSVTELASRWSVHPFDIIGWAMQGLLAISAALPPVESDGGKRATPVRAAGLVEIAGEDVIVLFRRDGVPGSSVQVRRFRREQADPWEWIVNPEEGVAITAADVLVSHGEAERFELRWGVFSQSKAVRSRMPMSGATRSVGGAPPRYNWDGFTGALARRIHDRGLPASQGELVRDMLNWFAESGSLIPDESTVRRRVQSVWRELTRPSP